MIRVSGAAPNMLGLMMNPIDILVEMQKAEGGPCPWWSEFLAFPQGVSANLDFYRDIMKDGDLPLSKRERHLVAAETCRVVGCNSNSEHHQQLVDEEEAGDEAKAELLADFSRAIAEDPTKAKSFRSRFHDLGFTTAQFQHAIFVASYSNFASRCALAIDAAADDEEIAGGLDQSDDGCQ